ncbi:MAG TPA: neutral/alkaline non-lysosomal ceramidase N-terminal domain-containing protein [Thermoanaerobaculia bacterium]|nr:neutral/alkaline non-lysosomal ceramidase N-terminal domain-containing protein [Thermoanaerobaculia bacterium]
MYLRGLILLALATVSPATLHAELRAGTGAGDVTPPIGTPSAGYGDRRGAGMTGVHDRLLASALALEDGGRRVVFVGVDHLGFDHDMVQRVVALAREDGASADTEIYLGSSHTHAGGGAYLDVPIVGEALAGKFDPAVRELYVRGAADAVRAALASLRPARIGIGYGEATLNSYRGDWPPNVETNRQVTVLKVTSPEGAPLGVLFAYPAHATVLSGANREFSADFVGYAREALRRELGESTVAVYFNGAQGDVSPAPPSGGEPFERAQAMGDALAAETLRVWNATETADTLEIATLRHRYTLEVQPTSAGVLLPMPPRGSELNLIVLGGAHAFLTVPGELSTIYDADLRRFAGWLGYQGLTILGLTNDAHGYLVTPEAWRHRIYESTVSFGGELYGERFEDLAQALLHALEPAGSYQEELKVPAGLLDASTTAHPNP